jgi:Nse1 non-SMC component of SMC5-6 complex
MEPTWLTDWRQVVRGEFEEIPDLRVTTEQASDRWNLEASHLEAILDSLVDSGFLCRSPEGVYSSGARGPLQSIKALSLGAPPV